MSAGEETPQTAATSHARSISTANRLMPPTTTPHRSAAIRWSARKANCGTANCEALPLLRELVTLRRQSTQMLLLADCERTVGDPRYIQTLEQAVRMNPRLWKVHEHLADHYRNAGDPKKAEHHRLRAVP